MSLAYIGRISSGATERRLGAGALFDEVPAVPQPEPLLIRLLIALGALGGLLLQLLATLLIPDPLDLSPLFHRHSPPDPTLLGRFPFGALPGAEAGTYLLEERTFALVPVARLLPETLSPRPPM